MQSTLYLEPAFHFDADPDAATLMRILYGWGVTSHGSVVSLHGFRESLRGSVAGSSFPTFQFNAVADPTLLLGCELGSRCGSRSATLLTLDHRLVLAICFECITGSGFLIT
jgi:hypothetical protein